MKIYKLFSITSISSLGDYTCVITYYTHNILDNKKNFSYYKYMKMQTWLKSDTRENISRSLQQLNHKYRAGNNRPSEVLHSLQKYSRTLITISFSSATELLLYTNLVVAAVKGLIELNWFLNWASFPM